MKRKEVLQGIISTMQSELPFPVLPRELELPVVSGQMITVTGCRRCGKSSLLKIAANRIVESGVSPQKILWVNFDDERLDGMQADELDEILQAYREMFPATNLHDVHIFFDEIQNVPKWELFVLRLYKTYCQNIYLSGSNAKMLSSQLATALRGWPVEFEEFPLSFREYLTFRGIDANRFSESGRAALITSFRKYLHESSFPEVTLMQEPSLKIRKVQGYFNTMLFRDLVEHYKLGNSEVVRYFLKRIMANLSKPTSVNALYNDLKSQGHKITKDRLYEVAQMACDVFMFFRVGRWSRSLAAENNRLPKYYIIDNGMRNAVILPQSDDNGPLLENAVFMHLRRHCTPAHRISYFLESAECDFVVQQNERITQLVQVCWSLDNPETRTRELRGLAEASRATGCTRCTIVTLEEGETITHEGLTVEVVPAWKWLLADPFFKPRL